MYLYFGLGLTGLAAFLASYHYNRRLLDWLRFQSLGTRDYIVERLGQMFIEIPPQKILTWMFMGSFGLGGLVFILLIPQWFPAAVFGALATVAGWKAPRPIIDILYQRRVTKFVFQLVDALNLMSNGLKSGLSVVQSIGLVTQEMPNPIQQEFNLVLSENKLGVPLEEALNNMARRVMADDVEMLVTSINILKETGGNLAETFDTIAGTIRERIKVQKKIEVMTTQGKIQGFTIMAVPPMMGLVFYQSDPVFMQPLFNTPLGWAVIMLILVLEIVGFFVIMKIVRVDV